MTSISPLLQPAAYTIGLYFLPCTNSTFRGFSSFLRLTQTYISLSLGHDLEPSWFSKGGIQGKNIYYTAQMYTISFVQDIHKLLMWRNFILGTAYPNSLFTSWHVVFLSSNKKHGKYIIRLCKSQSPLSWGILKVYRVLEGHCSRQEPVAMYLVTRLRWSRGNSNGSRRPKNKIKVDATMKGWLIALASLGNFLSTDLFWGLRSGSVIFAMSGWC